MSDDRTCRTCRRRKDFLVPCDWLARQAGLVKPPCPWYEEGAPGEICDQEDGSACTVEMDVSAPVRQAARQAQDARENLAELMECLEAMDSDTACSTREQEIYTKVKLANEALDKAFEAVVSIGAATWLEIRRGGTKPYASSCLRDEISSLLLRAKKLLKMLLFISAYLLKPRE